LHDLTLAVDVVRHLRIPFGVIINRDGVGDTRIETYCQQEKIPILLKIPERQKIAYLYSKGIALADEAHEWHEMFALLFNRIKKDVMK
jgi:MinD superfamily P-loop ATPase